MNQGISVDLNELIALKRYAQKANMTREKRGQGTGNHTAKIRGRGMDFAEVRNYQAGYEIRHMEWRVTARTGRPHVKIYQEERERPVVLLMDFNPSMYFGTRVAFKSVIAARLAALIAWTAIKQGDRVGGILFSAQKQTEFTPKGRETAVLPLLASLSHYTQIIASSHLNPKPLSEALLRVRRVTRPGSVIVLLSDFYNLDEDSERHLNRLRAHNDMLAYHIADPLELNPPKPGCYAISNGQEELLLDTNSIETTRLYQQYCEQGIHKVKAQLTRLQTPYILVGPETALPNLVRTTFARGPYV